MDDDPVLERRLAAVRRVSEHLTDLALKMAQVTRPTGRDFCVQLASAAFESGLDVGIRAAALDLEGALRLRDGAAINSAGPWLAEATGITIDAANDDANAMALEFLDIYRQG